MRFHRGADPNATRCRIMSLDNHFRSVGQVSQAVEAGPVDPLLIYGLLGILSLGVIGAAWFTLAMLRERYIAGRLLRELEKGPI